VMAMRGDRSDRPHRNAYDSAHALIATWSAEFLDEDWPEAWRDKTFYAGPISRLEIAEPIRKIDHSGPGHVLVLWGAGGSDTPGASFTPGQLASASSSAPGWVWRFAGGSGADRIAESEVRPLLSWADVVVTHAGQNAVAEVAASRTPAIVIADARPHGEQLDTARALDAAGIAIGLPEWPADDRWPALLQAAQALNGSFWARWLSADGATRAAGFLQDTACSLRRPSAIGGSAP